MANDSQKFIQTLMDAGYEPSSYSGRGMFGKQCVSVSGVSAWEIAKAIWYYREDNFMDVPEPHQDSLGRGTVLYWPSMDWVEVEHPADCDCRHCEPEPVDAEERYSHED